MLNETNQDKAETIRQTRPEEDKLLRKKKHRRLFYTGLSFAIVLWCGLTYVSLAPSKASDIYNRLLFAPWKYPKGFYQNTAQLESVKGTNLFFKSKNGSTLHGLLFKKPGAHYTVLYHHGNGANLSVLRYFAKVFLQSNCSVLLYDYQGYGKSEGTPNLQNVTEDSEAAYTCLTQQLKVPPETIIHCGGSFGSGLASQVAGKHPGRALILFTPYRSIHSVARKVLPFLNIYPDALLSNPNIDTLAYLKGNHAPLWMAHGDCDITIPVSEADTIFKEAKEPKTYLRMKGIGHGNFTTDEFEAGLKGFIASLK
jgi:pimeloyl-ACP methyl ester carboxylesterase